MFTLFKFSNPITYIFISRVLICVRFIKILKQVNYSCKPKAGERCE